MKLRTLNPAELINKTVLYRAPYDIEPTVVNGHYQILDDSRIRATIPTLRNLISSGCKIGIVTWVGRPKGPDPLLSTKIHAQILSSLLDTPVNHIGNCIGAPVKIAVQSLPRGGLIMLENTRFHPEDETNDDQFAQDLAAPFDLCVFDAFPQAHRTHASTTGVLHHLPSYAGLYLQHEVESLQKITVNPIHPLTVIIGGAKISDKTEAVKNLATIADHILVGGVVANIFLKAKGFDVANSLIEENAITNKSTDWIGFAKDLLAQFPQKIILPSDVFITDNLQLPQQKQIVSCNQIPSSSIVVDIGPQTQMFFTQIIQHSKTVFWCGPLGLTKNNLFTTGSVSILQSMEKVTGTTIIAGGDTINLVNRFSSPDRFSLISLAGGATLEFLANHPLPALELLREN